MLPAIRQGSLVSIDTNMPPLLFEILNEEKSTKPAGLVVHDVEHKKFVLGDGKGGGIPAPLQYISNNLDVCFNSVDDTSIKYYSKGQSYDCLPHSALLQGMLQRSEWVNNPTNFSLGLFASTIPATEKARLPAFVLAKTRELSLGQTVSEAHQLMDLFKFMQLRKSLTDMLEKGPDGRFLDSPLIDATRHLIQNLKGASKAKRARIYRDLRKQVSGTALGYLFGLSPTLEDAISIAEKCAKGFKERRKQYVHRVRTTSRVTRDAKRWSVVGSIQNASFVESIVGTRVDGVILTDLRPKYHSPAFQKWADRIDAGFGLNPVGAIWETLPFSFCIDWFTSLDDVLDAMFLRYTSSFSTQYWTSTKCVVNMYAQTSIPRDVKGNYPQAPMWEWRSDIKGYITVSDYVRRKTDSPSPVDAFRYRLSTFGGFASILMALGL